MIDMSWRHRAACRTEEPELFFPIGTSEPALGQLAEARSVCRGCPVVVECRLGLHPTVSEAPLPAGISGRPGGRAPSPEHTDIA